MINLQGSFKKSMMKNWMLFILLVFGQTILWAQKPSLKKANNLFENRSYVEAANMYKQLEATPEILERLGDCFYYNGRMEQARTPYTNLYVEYRDSMPEEALFKYAQVLKGLKDYENGDQVMGEYLGYPVDTPKFSENLNGIVPYNYMIKRVSRNSSTGDFGVSYYFNKIIFSSVRNSDNPKYGWNDRPYLDLYKADMTEDFELEHIEPFSDEINTETHESNAAFSPDGLTMYFSRTNEKRVKIDGIKIATVKLFKAERVEDEWTNVTELPFSSDTYSTMHPAVSPDGITLYFSSDMPGSLGSFDIYSVEILDDGFGTPVNLGETINTKQRDQFPFMDKDNMLYFTSDGHEGLGNLDLFMSQKIDNAYTKPLNLGETINSEMDDFAFVLHENQTKGFFSSNREGGDNLYSFVRMSNTRKFAVEGEVTDKHSKELLPGTTVTLFDENGELVGQMVTGSDATYIFNTRPNTTYTIEAHKDFYIPSSQSFTTNEDGRVFFDIQLEIESYDDAEDIVVTKDDGYVYIELENIYFDLNKWEIKPQAAQVLDVLVNLLRKYPRMEVQLGAHTDNRASDLYNLRLSRNRAEATLEYIVSQGIDRNRLKSKGYGERKPLVDCGTECTEAEHSINRRCEFLILK